MDNGTKIRKLLQDISIKLDGKVSITYQSLTRIIISMEKKYNLTEEGIIKQLENILESLED